MQSAKRRPGADRGRVPLAKDWKKTFEDGGVKVTWSVVGLGFVLGFVSMLVMAEVEKKPPSFECPSNIEVKALVTGVGQNQYLDDLLKMGMDRVDIIASSRYSDVQDIGMKPYHWAILKAEALRVTLHRRVPIASLLRGEDLHHVVNPQDGHSSTPPPDQESSQDFFNIPQNIYVPANFEKVTVTTILTGTLQERLGGLFNAAVLGRSLNARLHVIWDVNKNCGVKISSILSVSERVSYSTLGPEKELSSVFYSKTVLEDFTGVFTMENSVVGRVMEGDVMPKGSTSLWWVKDAHNVTVGEGGEVTGWVKERIELGLKTHLLYEVVTVVPGVTMEKVKEAVEFYAITPSSEIYEKVKRVAEAADITEHNTLAVYDSEIPTLRTNDVFGRKIYLMTTPTLPAYNTTSPIVLSPYNAGTSHSNPSTDFDLFASSVLLTANGIPLHGVEDSASPVSPEKTELLISAVLCPSGIVCPKNAVVEK